MTGARTRLAGSGAFILLRRERNISSKCGRLNLMQITFETWS